MRTNYHKHNPPDMNLCPPNLQQIAIKQITTAAENMQIHPSYTCYTPTESTPIPVYEDPIIHPIPSIPNTVPEDEYFFKQDIPPILPNKVVTRAMAPPLTNVQVHVDGGANRSVTNNIHLLTGYRDIKRYPLNGVSGDGPAVYCTGSGYLPWKADSQTSVFIKCYYSKDVAETIDSLTDVVMNHLTDINAW